MEGKVEVVEEERDQDKSSGQSQSLSLLLSAHGVNGVIDQESQDSISVICHGRSGSPQGLVLLKRSVGVPDKGS